MSSITIIDSEHVRVRQTGYKTVVYTMSELAKLLDGEIEDNARRVELGKAFMFLSEKRRAAQVSPPRSKFSRLLSGG